MIYTGTAVTSKVMRVLGYFEYTLTTAGTWNTAPSAGLLYAPGIRLPGEVVQRRLTAYSAVATGTGTTPADDTIPQNTEGNEFMSQSITPTAAANMLRCFVGAFCANSASGANGISSALFRDSGADAIYSHVTSSAASGHAIVQRIETPLILAASTASTTFKWRVGGHTASTTTFNGSAGIRIHGASNKSTIAVEEIQV